jgi:hypothetical protein
MMNQIKTICSTALIVSLVFGMALFTACDKDIKYNGTTLVRPCDNVICFNGGACLDGQCKCTQGFEGDKCTIKWSDKFVGSYQASDVCQNGIFYNVLINPVPDFAWKIKLQNLGKFCPGTTITAEINPEKTSFIIPLQNTCGNFYLSGDGNLSGGFINVNLKNRDSLNHTTEQCSILLNKM